MIRRFHIYRVCSYRVYMKGRFKCLHDATLYKFTYFAALHITECTVLHVYMFRRCRALI